MTRLLQMSFAVLCTFAAAPAFAGLTLPPTPVPEPVSLSILAVGVAGAAVVRGMRSRRK
jgi:hypothetical protein